MRADTDCQPTTVVMPSDISADSVVALDRQLQSILRPGLTYIEVDTSRWEHVTSSHVHVLWQTYCTCQEQGVALRLKNPSFGLIRVLKVLDLYDIIAEGADQEPPDLKEAAQSQLGKGTLKYADDFKADSASVDRALANFLSFLKELGVPRLLEFELRTLFYEIATNIRTHGHLAKDDLIVFACRTDESTIHLAFADSGLPFDPTASTAYIDVIKAGKERQMRGFGIMMIRKLADELSYLRKNNAVNVLTVEKRWNRQN